VIEVGNAVSCGHCEEMYCRSCAAGGKSGILGGTARVIGAFYTMGVSELVRSQLLKCPRCKTNEKLIRI
jgi:hypothetical protein